LEKFGRRRIFHFPLEVATCRVFPVILLFLGNFLMCAADHPKIDGNYAQHADHTYGDACFHDQPSRSEKKKETDPVET
jgi:hypothetical protein